MTTRLSILFIVNDLRFGGAEKHVVTLLNSINTAQFKLTLVCLKSRTELLPQIDIARVEGGVIQAGVSSRVDWRAARVIARAIDSQRIDVAVCTNSFSLFYGSIASRLSTRRPPLIEVFHTTQLVNWKAKLQMAFYRPFFRAAELVVFVCEAQRTYWHARRLAVAKDVVIHNGIDVRHFMNTFVPAEINAIRAQHGIKQDDFVVGICAALRPEKAHADLLAALILLRKQGHMFNCLIIGDGPERINLERIISQHGLHKDVIITGFVADVRKHVAACDIMALVSHTETFSLSALEAMALGKPMVMSDVGGAAEQIIEGENGYLFPAGDIRQLASAIVATRDRNREGAMDRSARQSVIDRFSLERMVEKFEHAFLSLAGRKDKLPKPNHRQVATEMRSQQHRES